MRIRPLPTAVANQIAAGEVIENPASVVKELLENALDAGASNITIDIGFGGLNYIKVSDNGHGIMAADVLLAIAPHATSKLTTLSDLANLTSMGFRGEALASIASISRLTLITKHANDAEGVMLKAEGALLEQRSIARNQGLTVEVSDLFYNAPVRRRFLKSERSEYLLIEHVVKRFALSAPHIAISLTHNGKRVLDYPPAGDNVKQRVQKIFGKRFVEHAMMLDVERTGMRLIGFINGQEIQRSQNDQQWVYLNQRMVKDKLIHHAIKKAYANILYPGRYPACLLYLSVPTTEVDVNVHPTKHEVRFLAPRLVHDFIEKHIAEALKSTASSTLNLTYPPPAISPRDVAIEVPTAPNPLHFLQLNSAFGVMLWQEEAYLLDINAGQKARTIAILSEAHFPLQSRPLLVPLVIETVDESVQKTLLDYGLWVGLYEGRWVVKTVPVDFPQLDIQAFIAGLQRQEIVLDVLASNETDKEALLDFVAQQFAKGVVPVYVRKLDAEQCMKVLYAD